MEFFRGPDPKFRPVIDKVFPLAEAAAAHRRMEERQHFGKIVLSM
jgi:NADPH:quinone reductase-like Zn-dependent oxidoreductase